MSEKNLTKRDFEIMRTLVRVQLARTRSLQGVFFPNMGVTRRRLRALRSYGLIATHNKGLPGDLAATGGTYWRLTDRGLSVTSNEFPKDRVPENLVARTKRASLRCFEHRDEMTEAYLRLIYSQDQDWDEIRTRSNSINWQGEYEVTLTYPGRTTDNPSRVVPDATLTTAEQRIFIEVDRSTESHSRCKRALNGYRVAISHGSYHRQFSDSLPVTVLYITKSARRAKGLQNIYANLLTTTFKCIALPTAKATEWLLNMTGGPTVEEPDSSVDELELARALLRNLYMDYRALIIELGNRGQRCSTPEPMKEALVFLNRHAQALGGAQ